MVAQFAGSHGVRGEFKLRSFTENPLRLFTYGPLLTQDGKVLKPALVREHKPGVFICRDPAITSPEACAPFKGALLHVDRDALPETEDEDDFYVEDLIGLEARLEDGTAIGVVRAVPNYGAGDIVEIESAAGPVLVPFTKDAVPVVDLDAGTLILVLPEDEPPHRDD